jgi:hypothetical protein
VDDAPLLVDVAGSVRKDRSVLVEHLVHSPPQNRRSRVVELDQGERGHG